MARMQQCIPQPERFANFYVEQLFDRRQAFTKKLKNQKSSVVSRQLAVTTTKTETMKS
jgi:hypothetical protein